MIKIAASARFSFIFPADRVTTYEFYSDINRLVRYLQHIDLVDSSAEHQYRLYYSTVELGTYHIHVYADVRLDLVPGHHTMRMVPIENLPPIETEVTFNSTKTRGYYSSEAFFHDEGDQTRVEYLLKMQAKPPRPKGMRFMPGTLVDKIANNITNNRMREIAEYFIESSVADYPNWLDEKAAPAGDDA
ncbi:MAG: DUF1997 domain-containing protein [Chloroflexi bacterium]|nr:DUF1997 domain-containing protein [Chloroflexota bacterium]